MIMDSKGFTETALAFNKSVFYPNRPILLEGYDEEGDPITGVYLIQKVKQDKLTVINAQGSIFTFDIEQLCDYNDNDSVIPASIQVTFFTEKEKPYESKS